MGCRRVCGPGGVRGDLVCVTASASASVLPVALSATSCALDGGL